MSGNRHWCGSLAQLGEHLPYKQGVTGSSPVTPTNFLGPVVQLVRMPACHAGGHRFEPGSGRHFFMYFDINILCWRGSMAEQLICNQQVDGSTPPASSIFTEEFPSGQRGRTVNPLAALSMVRIHLPPPIMRKWLRGRASPCQGEGREFESRLPLQCLRM